MKYGADSFKGITPRVRGKQRQRKISRKQERRLARSQCKDF